MLRAHAAARDAIKAICPEVKVGLTLSLHDLQAQPDGEAFAARLRETLKDLQTSTPVDAERPVYYPGQNMMRLRRENMEIGIPVEDSVWEGVKKL